MSTTDDRLDQLEARLNQLEEENKRKDERIDELEDDLEFFKTTLFNLQDHVYGEYDSYTADGIVEEEGGVLNQIEAVNERINAIERGEIDPGEVVANSNAGVDPSDLLPLHNNYLIAQNMDASEHELTQNQEIAARLFPYLAEYAYSNEGKMMLPSTKVKDILKREIATPELEQRLDVKDPNANTIRRAMQFVGKFGKDMMEFDDSEKMNRIVIDREAWVNYTQEISEVATSNDSTVNTADDAVEEENTAEDGVEEEMDRLNDEVITVS